MVAFNQQQRGISTRNAVISRLRVTDGLGGVHGRVAHNRIWRVRDRVARLNDGTESFVLFSPRYWGTAAQSLVKPVPKLKHFSRKCHVTPGAQTAEMGHLKPEWVLPIYTSSL